jgi:hypothetical protein
MLTILMLLLGTYHLVCDPIMYRVEQKERMFFKWLVLGKGGVDDIGRELADKSDNAVLVAVAHWNVEHCVFAVEQFFRNNDSIVTVQPDEKHAFPLLHPV